MKLKNLESKFSCSSLLNQDQNFAIFQNIKIKKKTDLTILHQNIIRMRIFSPGPPFSESQFAQIFNSDFLRNLAFGCGCAAVTSAILVELYKKVKTSKFGKIGF